MGIVVIQCLGDFGMKIKINKSKNYTVMSNRHLKEPKMSLKAKGLLSLMLSLPDDWNYTINGLCAICVENETAIKSALSELKTFGYLTVVKNMPNTTKSGRIEYEYNIYEIPQKQDSEKQGIENLPLENQPVDNPTQLNTNILNTEEENIEDNTLTNVRGESRDVALTPPAKKSLLGNFKSSEILEKKVKGVEILAEDEVQKKKDSKDARMREQFSERFIKYCVEVEKINSPKFLEAVKGYLFTTAHKYGFKMSEQQMQCFFKVLQGWNKEYGMGVLLQVIEKATAAGDKIQDYMFQKFNRTNQRRGNAPMDFNNKGLSSPEEEEMEKELQYSKDTISGVF